MHKFLAAVGNPRRYVRWNDEMTAGMAKGMQGSMTQMMKGMVEYPPMITILKCMSCDAALSIKLHSSGSSD